MSQPQNSKDFSTADLAAIERDSQYVNQEQILAAAFFAKQLQADLGGIKRAQIGDGLKVPDVDMTKVMPSEIFKTFRPIGRSLPPAPPAPPAPVAIPNPVPVQMPEFKPQAQFVPPVAIQPLVSQVSTPVDNNQLELDFNRTTRYEEVVLAIEKLESKVNMVNEKLDLLLADKKKLKTKLPNQNGTQAG